MGPHLLTGWFAAIAETSDHKEAAALFVDYMTNSESAALWNMPGGQVPMMRSVAARPEMQEPEFAHLQETSELMAETGTLIPGVCNWARTLADFNLATQRVVLGEITPEEAVAEMAEATAARQ